MKPSYIARPVYLLTIAAMLLSASVFAQTQGGPPQEQGNGDHPHGPPPEAIAACAGKSSGASCGFVGRQGEQLTGTCFSPPPHGQQSQQVKPGIAPATGNATDQGVKPLACRPARMGN
jgi:hypothetical protein